MVEASTIPESLGEKEIRLIYDFTTKTVHEFKLFIKSVVVFGSFARGDITTSGDIDIMILVDDGAIELRGEVKKYYEHELRRIIESEHSPLRFHVNTVPLSEFWDGVRMGDPILLNIIREGLPIFDRGFFVPVKKLLEQGKIRPSIEAVYLSLDNADVHLLRCNEFKLKAATEIYWAVIDCVNAALMSEKKIPADPKHASKLLRETYLSDGRLSEEDIQFMDDIYKLMKKIARGEITDIPGGEVDVLREKADTFIRKLRDIVIANEKRMLGDA